MTTKEKEVYLTLLGIPSFQIMVYGEKYMRWQVNEPKENHIYKGSLNTDGAYELLTE